MTLTHSLRDSIELFADACAAPSLRDDLGAGYDIAGGARLLAERRVERACPRCEYVTTDRPALRHHVMVTCPNRVAKAA